jgi:hypothetical protein
VLSHCTVVYFLSQVSEIWGTSPSLYCEALHSSTGSTLIEENKPVQHTNISVASDTRTQGEDENRLEVEDSVSGSCQLGRADNTGYTLPEARQAQHCETELYI